MNGDTGFHHKAAKGKAVGGHFKRSVNTARSHLCRLSKQHVSKTALKRRRRRRLQQRRLSGKGPEVFSEHLLTARTVPWTRFPRRGNQEGGRRTERDRRGGRRRTDATELLHKYAVDASTPPPSLSLPPSLG